MRPHSALASRVPSALRFLMSCNGMPIDDIQRHFERHIGGLLPPTQLRAAVARLVKDAVRAGTLTLRNRRYSVSATWLPNSRLPSPHQCSLCDVSKPLAVRTRRRVGRRRRKNDSGRRTQQSESVKELWVRDQDEANQPEVDPDADADFSTISSIDVQGQDSMNDDIAPEPSSAAGQMSLK